MNQLHQCLNFLFEVLEREKIGYCILRDYEHLPEKKAENSDIDMIVARNEAAKLDEIFLQLSLRFQLKLLPIVRRSYVKSYRLSKVDLQGSFFLIVDIHTDEEFYGFVYLHGEEVLKRRRKYKNFYIPGPLDEAIVSWFSSYLSGGFIKKKHVGAILKAIEDHKVEFPIALSSIIGRKVARRLSSLIEREGLESTLRLRRAVVWRVLLNSFKRRPFRQLIKVFLFFFAELRIRIRPPGIMVAFIGPDGSGKSTIALEVFKRISNVVHSEKSRVIHWRPGFLPRLGYVYKPWKWKDVNAAPNTSPHASAPSGPLLSIVRLSYYLIDFTVGFFFRTYRLLIRNAFIFFDRYYYDIIIDPSRSRIRLPPWVLKLFLPLVPKPDVTIYLDASPETLCARKPELPLCELARQVREFRELISHLPSPHIISTERPLCESVYEVSSAIIDRISEQADGQLLFEKEYSLVSSLSRHYLTLPSKKNCRWLIPARADLARKSWEIYVPYSLSGNAYKVIMRTLTSAGLLKPFSWMTDDPDASAELLEFRRILSDLFGRGDLVPSLSTGTPGPFRKATAMIISPDGAILGYVKIGRARAARERIKHEAEVLKDLRDRLSWQESPMKIPDCLYECDISACRLLVQTAAPCAWKKGRASFGSEYAEVLAWLIRSTAASKTFGESSFCQRLEEGISSHSLSFKDLLATSLNMLKERLNTTEVTFALSHGDFAPWNTRWRDGEAFLFDWESAILEAPVGMDLTHFLLQTGFHLKRYRGKKLLSFITQGSEATYNLLFAKAGIKPIPLDGLAIAYLLHQAITEDEPNLLSPAAVERRRLLELLIAHQGSRR